MYKQQQYTYFEPDEDPSLPSSPLPSSSPPPPSASLYPILMAEERERRQIERERNSDEETREREEERGREREEDAPYPPVEIWKPPSHRWYQKQVVGKTIGKLFLVGGGWGLYEYFRLVNAAARRSTISLSRKIAAKMMKQPPAYLVIAGTFCVGVGIYLHFKKYLRDPKAIMKYRKRIFDPTTAFQSAVDEFGWNDLFVIATKEELCYKLYQEMQSVRGLYQICSIYKVNNLRAYLSHDVMRAIDVEARWEYDVIRAAEGTGPELGIVVQECGEFLLTASRMQADKIRESLEKDPTMVNYTFSDIFTKFESSIRRIFKKGFLSTAFLRHKLIAQLNTDSNFKFSLVAKHRWIVECLCTPPELALAFRSARENCSCIVTFLDLYWTWPIEAYKTLIIPDELELAKLKQIHDESHAFSNSMQNETAHATKRYNENMGEIMRIKEKKSENVRREANKQLHYIQLHPPSDGSIIEPVNEIYRKQTEDLEKINEEERAAIKKEQQAREDKIRSAERQMETKKIELHKEWRSFLVQRRYSNPAQTPAYTPVPSYSFAAPSAPPM